MSTYACLAALVPSKKQPAIRVKIVRKWMSPVGSIRPKTWMVFGDEKVSTLFTISVYCFLSKCSNVLINLLQQGSMIEATLPWGVDLPFGINLQEGDWFEINDFKLGYASGMFRTTKNKYQIKLIRNSVFSKIQPITECNFLYCASYNTILCGLSHPKFCIGM